ncbi:MAG: hypothetical protein AAGA43_12115 [Bacteroidota bacterium]
MRNKNTIVVLTTSNENLYNEKFFEPIGPNNEMLLEYTIFDAIEAGFKRIILVVPDHIGNSIKNNVHDKFKKHAQIHWVGIKPMSLLSLTRRIPYHLFSFNSYALWKVKHLIKGPFLVVNGRFFHGKNTYREALNFLSLDNRDLVVLNCPLRMTLSPYGGVNRGICITEKESDSLKRIVEVKKVRKHKLGIDHEDRNLMDISEEMLATTGVYCLHKDYFRSYRAFLKSSKMGYSNDKNKATIPSLINYSLREKICNARAVTIESNWFSINFKPERVLAISKIREMIIRQEYPEKLHYLRTR